MMLRCIILFILSLAATVPITAQSARATENILFRTLMVKTSTDQGAMFSIEVDGREYWLTAKHLITGAKHPPIGSITVKEVSLSVLDPSVAEIKWMPYEFSVIDPGKDIDIAILAPKQSLQHVRIDSLPVQSDKVPVGGECEFLGFPFANTWLAHLPDGTSYRMPFIKHCYISGQITGTVWILDGINNEGFSGGPVVVHTGSDQKIIGVVSGYQSENSDVISVPLNQQPPAHKPTKSRPADTAKTKNVVQTNTGLVFAFDAGRAIDAIRKNPIGPLVGTK